MVRFQVARAYVINLRRRTDRLHSFYERLRRVDDWPFPEVIVYPAIEGDVVGVPPEFLCGGGAYGCRMSHVRILQDCLMEGVEPVLIMEDDVDFCPDFGRKVREFFERVPDDWEGLMIGGQHHAPPQAVAPGIVRVRYAQRTHAYIARGNYMRGLQMRWGNATVHIDWRMKDWQHQYRVYAPDPWLCGQAGGRSDIRGAMKPTEWWLGHEHLTCGPVAIAIVPSGVVEELVAAGCHIGMTRLPGQPDAGLEVIANLPNRDEQIRELRHWLKMLASEAVGGLLPTVYHPRIPPELVRAAWPGEVYVLVGQTADEALSCLPSEIREAQEARKRLITPPFLLLRAGKDVIDRLHEYGFHPGYWRDKETGLDCGLVEIFRQPLSADEIVRRLKGWCSVIEMEADREGMVPCAVHPAISKALLERATRRRVIEMSVSTAAEIRERLIGSADGDLRMVKSSSS